MKIYVFQFDEFFFQKNKSMITIDFQPLIYHDFFKILVTIPKINPPVQTFAFIAQSPTHYKVIFYRYFRII